jgi:hypothetical protein
MNVIAWLGMVAAAQTPSERWRTVKTEHFRVHYPEVASAWSLDAASRLEEWHSRVAEEVGFMPPQRIDVVVVDPFSQANGLAVPLARGPRTMLFATPPEAASVIGHYRSWSEILLVHEDTHLVHMLRPPRNPLERVMYSLFGVGPVAAKSPRWVTEGYATVVEGRLTGFGRPHGDYRALMLRRLAQRGQLPQYSQLDVSARWQGGSFAYLVGSAYLEWLEERTGSGSLRQLWARMTARRMRSFDEAFEGVFGEPPNELYGRFVAEITADAMAMERAEPPAEEVLLELGWNVQPPDVSPDGERVALPIFPRMGTPRIDVYAVDIDDAQVKRRLEARDRQQEKDPLDVPAVPSEPPPHERLFSRASRGVAAQEVRFLADGSGLLFSAWTRDARGRVRPDLYRWTFPPDEAEEDEPEEDEPEEGEAEEGEAEEGEEPEAERPRRPGTERLTRGQDLRTPDPAPDGSWAAAVRVDWGLTQIVRVDLETGQWTEITSLSHTQVDFPRVSPDGQRVAWLSNSGAGFGIVIRELSTGDEWKSEPSAEGGMAYALAWSEDGRALLATMGHEGLVEVHEVWREDGRGRGRLTHTAGGAWMADPLDRDDVAFLSMSHRGWDLHRATLSPDGLDDTAVGSTPVRRPPALLDAPAMPAAQTLEPRPYGLGPIDISPLAGASLTTAATHSQVELGVRVGDPVGRSEILLLGAYGPPTGGMRGARLSFAWRRLPMDLRLDGTFGGDPAFGTYRTGVALALDREWHGTSTLATALVGGLVESALPDDEHGDRQLASARLGFSWSEASRGWLGLSTAVRGSLGRTASNPWAQVVGAATLRVLPSTPLAATYEFGWSNGETLLDTFVLGGVLSTVSTDLADNWRVADPAFGPGIISGQVHDRMELALETPLALYGVRHRFVSDEVSGLTAVGARIRQSFDEQPFFQVPAGRMDLGVACRIEYPGLGFDSRPCFYADDWATWLSVTFER